MNIISNAGLIFLCILLSSCERSWHFAITDIKDLNYPEMCISTKENCTGDPVDATILSVEELDTAGNSLKTAWAMQSINNVPIKKFSYGTAPTGWRELMHAAPIEAGKKYRIGMHTFSCQRESGCLIE